MGTGLIYTQIPKVMASIGAIGKDRKNPQQGYQFRGIDDLYNACNAALAEHQVFAVPEVINVAREERTTKSGGALLYTILTMRYAFYASDGSHVDAITVGEAMDSGDKSCNKAMSAAQKYAFLQVFSIPTEEPKDSENDSPEPAPKKQNRTDTNPSFTGSTISDFEATTLEALVQQAGADVGNFLKFYEVDSFLKFPKAKLKDAMDKLKKKLEKKAA